MDLSISADLARISAAHRPPAEPVRKPTGKMEKAAQDFEAILLGSLLDSLQKTVSGASENGSPGSADYSFMGAQALASAIAANGGIGIGRLILGQWQRTKVPGGG